MKKQAFMIVFLLFLAGLLSICQGICQSTSSIRVIYNLDETMYFGGGLGPCTASGVDAFASNHAAAGVTDMFINVNSQRVNYRSNVWEAYWDGPNDNDCSQMKVFENQGLDYPTLMINSARRYKMKAWISVRMNDAHEGANPSSPYHSTFWRAHPEWYINANGSLDWERQEVRDYCMLLIKELCTRYDMDGLELDFQRFSEYFRVGHEHAGIKLMTAFIIEVRKETQNAAKRLGHPVELAVRVPTTPFVAKQYAGLDAVTWAKAGLVDMIIAACAWASTDTDVPIEAWKGLLMGTKTSVVIGLEDGINGDGQFRRTMTIDEMRGTILSALTRGADGVYFFNLYGGPLTLWPISDYYRIMKESSDLGALRVGRRNAIARHSVWVASEAGPQSPLPYWGTKGVYRIHIGPRPQPKQPVFVELTSPFTTTPPTVYVNGILCTWVYNTQSEHIKLLPSEVEPTGVYSRKRFVYSVPTTAVEDGYNNIEVDFPSNSYITWLEMRVQ